MPEIKILTGDCLAWLAKISDNSIHCVVTSPPYFGLRDYGTASWVGGDPACTHAAPDEAGATSKPSEGQRSHAGRFLGHNCHRCGAQRIDAQIGLEPAPAEFVAKLVAVFREVRRVLRPDGTLWLNLGDSYASAWVCNRRSVVGAGSLENGKRANRPNRLVEGLKEKDLMGMPWRVALALQADGWYLRQDIIWSKPNPMPESVRDRCTKSHEYLFLLSKSEKYHFDSEAIAEPVAASTVAASTVATSTVARLAQPNLENQKGSDRVPGKTNGPMKAVGRGGKTSFRGQGHFRDGNGPANRDDRDMQSVGTGELRNRRSVWTVTTKPFKEAHFATFPPKLIEPCILAGCPVGGIVLDPFGGAGTTGLVAKALNRHAVLIELNPAYVEIAARRIGV